jgi:hypothetical protein
VYDGFIVKLNIRSIKYINFYINLLIITKSFNRASERTCARPPNPQAAWIHQIHAAGGTGSSTTMVAVFIGLVVCCGWARDFMSLSYVKTDAKITLR